MPTRNEFRQSAEMRIKESKILFRNKQFEGAFYLAGYAIEFALKAAVCRNLDIDDFFNENPSTKLKGGLTREFKTHDISTLIILAGLIKKLDGHKAIDPDFMVNWSYIEQMNWTEQCRYDCPNPIKYNQTDVKAFIDAIDNRKGGFLRWISKFW